MKLDVILEKKFRELYKEFNVQPDENLILVDLTTSQHSYNPKDGYELYGPYKISNFLNNNQPVHIARTFMFYTTKDAFLENILAVFNKGKYVEPGTLSDDSFYQFFPNQKNSSLVKKAVSEYNKNSVVN